MAVALSQGDQLKEKVLALSAALLEKHPTMPSLLREIHTTLRQYPEQVVLLEDSDIAIIVAGLEKQTGVSLLMAGAKASVAKSASGKIKALGADAF